MRGEGSPSVSLPWALQAAICLNSRAVKSTVSAGQKQEQRKSWDRLSHPQQFIQVPVKDKLAMGDIWVPPGHSHTNGTAIRATRGI